MYLQAPMLNCCITGNCQALSTAHFWCGSYIVCPSQAGILDLHKWLIGKSWTWKKNLAVVCQSENTYSNFMQLDLTTNVQHMPISLELCPPVDIRSPTYANLRIAHYTHLSTVSIPHFTFCSAAFYQQPFFLLIASTALQCTTGFVVW